MPTAPPRACPRCRRIKCDCVSDPARAKTAARGYDAEWNRISKRKREAEPWCAVCLREGIYTPAQAVDHIVPMWAGGTHDDVNLQSICNDCNAKKRDIDRKQ